VCRENVHQKQILWGFQSQQQQSTIPKKNKIIKKNYLKNYLKKKNTGEFLTSP